jgi:hypothetical protein
VRIVESECAGVDVFHRQFATLIPEYPFPAGVCPHVRLRSSDQLSRCSRVRSPVSSTKADSSIRLTICRDKIQSALSIALGDLYPCPELVQAVVGPDSGPKSILDVGKLDCSRIYRISLLLKDVAQEDGMCKTRFWLQY